ncbi:MAG: hypothetical protein ACRCWU_02295 [Metamycoplasmataceae bacterium]
MNKKILLGLNATLLTITPLVAVVSCSESNTNKKIDTEAKKFSVIVETNKKDLVSTNAAETINNAPDFSSKLSALKNLVSSSSIPTLDNDFDFKINSAIVSETESTTINVSITVFEKSDISNEQNAIYSIKDFTAPSIVTIDDQVKLFEEAITTSNSLADPVAIVSAINGTSSEISKWDIIKDYVVIPQPAQGFGLTIVKNAVVRESTTIDVFIKIFEIINQNNFREVTLKIKGFTVIQEGINLEIAKFVPATTKSPNTPAFKFVENLNSIDANDKLHALSLAVKVPSLSNAYDLIVKSATMKSDSKTEVDVFLSIFHTNKPDSLVDIVYEIKEFRVSDIDTELARFTNTTTTSPDTSSIEIVEQIQSATSPELKLEILSSVVTLPILEEGYSFQIDWALVDKATNSSSILVLVSVFEDDLVGISKTIVYSIDGFRNSTLEINKAKFSSSITTNPNLSSIDMARNINLAQTPEEKLNALRTFAKIPTLEQGFGFEVKLANVNTTIDTTVEILISIYEIDGSTESLDVIYLITGLKRSTVDIEGTKFSQVITKERDVTTQKRVDAINLATSNIDKLNALKNIAEIPTLAQGFDFRVMSARISVAERAIIVRISVFEIAKPEINKEIDFSIIDFRVVTPLEHEAEKFNIILNAVNSITIEEASQILSINSGNNLVEELKLIVSEEMLPLLSEGYTFEVLGREQVIADKLPIVITITYEDENGQKSAMNALLIITSFQIK